MKKTKEKKERKQWIPRYSLFLLFEECVLYNTVYVCCFILSFFCVRTITLLFAFSLVCYDKGEIILFSNMLLTTFTSSGAQLHFECTINCLKTYVLIPLWAALPLLFFSTNFFVCFLSSLTDFYLDKSNKNIRSLLQIVRLVGVQRHKISNETVPAVTLYNYCHCLYNKHAHKTLYLCNGKLLRRQ
jgi:hypothetical protein